MTGWSPDPAMAAYSDGVTIIRELAAQFTDARWMSPTPCTDWRAADLAGHLRCVADDFHEYLDDAPASRFARLMATGASAGTLDLTIARQNAAELAQLPDVPPREHIIAFARSARSYGRRLPALWDRPHHRYRGVVVSVGAMAGLACAEWHLHAWDLARSLGKDYRPANPDIVLAGWREVMPQLRPAAAAAVPGEGHAAATPCHDQAAADPWQALLHASGRDTGWAA